MAITERPLIMKAPLVLATLAGVKTQTMRPINFGGNTGKAIGYCSPPGVGDGCSYLFEVETRPGFHRYFRVHCKLGNVGDYIYVRETWADADCFYQSYKNDCPSVVAYKADRSAINFNAPSPWAIPARDISSWNWDKVKWRPSIHQPKDFSRLWLKNLAVDAIRLQDTTEAEALAEGVRFTHGEDMSRYPVTPLMALENLWDSIYGETPYAWRHNPLVWRTKYCRVERPS